ncbi:MAG: Nif3-like dinuclear metal center hexameric protein, partial [Bacteroidales bacterium]
TAIEDVAPLSLQEKYDNSGLQIGNKKNDVTGVLLCIDVTEDVIDEAVENGINLVISHHPLLFKGLKSITGKNYIERTVIKAIRNEITVYAAHTNLDNAFGGVNYKIAEELGLGDISVLSPADEKLLKLVTFVPETNSTKVREALFAAGAGRIGNYDRCSYNMSGYGTFRAGEGADPYCGEIGQEHHEEEERIEVLFPAYLKDVILKRLFEAHCYEEPAYDITKIENKWKGVGSGVVGELLSPMDETDFLEMVKNVFHCGVIKHSNLLGGKVQRVALCGGAGAFLLPAAISSGADAFITGEIGYHDYFSTEEQILLVDAGHYETEQYTKDIFCDIITKKFPNFAVRYTKVGTNPVNYL